MQRAKKALSKPKRIFRNKRDHFSRKGAFGPEKVPYPSKKGLCQRPKWSFRGERVYLEPKGPSEAKKSLSGTKSKNKEPGEAFWSGKAPLGAGKGPFKASKDIFGSKTGPLEAKACPVIAKKGLVKVKRVLLESKRPFCSQKFSIGAKTAKGA